MRNSFAVWRSTRVRSLLVSLLMLVGPILARGAVPHLVLDINPGAGSSSPRQMSVTDGILYFSANDGAHGEKLWQSDGTAANTIMNAEGHPGKSDHPGRPDSSNSGLLADLIKTIFSSAGIDAKGNHPASEGGVSGNFASVNGILFFQADDGTHGAELWMSDGTAAGTVMVKDINPGRGGSSPGDMVSVNGALYFSADDGVHGRELWTSDGTASGTVMVADIAPGATGSAPASLTVAGSTLFFTADDGTHGSELWALSVPSTPVEISDLTVE